MCFGHTQYTFAVHAIVHHQQFFSFRQSRGYHRFDSESARATDWHSGIIAWSKSAEEFSSYGDQEVGKLFFAVTQIATQQGLLYTRGDVDRARIQENVP